MTNPSGSRRRLLGIGSALMLLPLLPAGSLIAQDIRPAEPSAGRTYSPYPKETFPNRVFFGDTHLHTAMSTDAGMVGQTVGPEGAFRFARGETVTSTTGLKAKLKRPLDFMVLSVRLTPTNPGRGPTICWWRFVVSPSTRSTPNCAARPRLGTAPAFSVSMPLESSGRSARPPACFGREILSITPVM